MEQKERSMRECGHKLTSGCEGELKEELELEKERGHISKNRCDGELKYELDQNA